MNHLIFQENEIKHIVSEFSWSGTQLPLHVHNKRQNGHICRSAHLSKSVAVNYNTVQLSIYRCPNTFFLRYLTVSCLAQSISSCLKAVWLSVSDQYFAVSPPPFDWNSQTCRNDCSTTITTPPLQTLLELSAPEAVQTTSKQAHIFHIIMTFA